jgi:hypothetical protein
MASYVEFERDILRDRVKAVIAQACRAVDRGRAVNSRKVRPAH